jgi:hypothetical protein
VRLLQRQLRERRHLQAGQPRYSAVYLRAVRRSGRRVLVERRLLQRQPVRAQSGRGRRRSRVHLLRAPVRSLVRDVHQQRRLLPGVRLPQRRVRSVRRHRRRAARRRRRWRQRRSRRRWLATRRWRASAPRRGMCQLRPALLDERQLLRRGPLHRRTVRVPRSMTR